MWALRGARRGASCHGRPGPSRARPRPRPDGAGNRSARPVTFLCHPRPFGTVTIRLGRANSGVLVPKPGARSIPWEPLARLRGSIAAGGAGAGAGLCGDAAGAGGVPAGARAPSKTCDNLSLSICKQKSPKTGIYSDASGPRGARASAAAQAAMGSPWRPPCPCRRTGRGVYTCSWRGGPLAAPPAPGPRRRA